MDGSVRGIVELYRVTHSPLYSQCLAGFSADGTYEHTEVVFSDPVDPNLFHGKSSDYLVRSWQPDGSGYSDKERAR